MTARVIDLPSRDELYARDIDVPFIPASNMKLPVSAADLDMLGVEHTLKTYLASDGDDLWVIGTGDPGIGDPRLTMGWGKTLGLFWVPFRGDHPRLVQLAGRLASLPGCLGASPTNRVVRDSCDVLTNALRLSRAKR